MGVFSRFMDIINSNINSLLDHAEDPEKMVKLMINEMEDTIIEIKTNCAAAIGAENTAKRKVAELEGLVVMVPRKGAEVAKITVKDLKDALEVRMAMEALSVRLACERIDEKGKEELKTACISFKEAINSKLVPAIVERDEAFHNVIYKASKNNKLINITQNLREQVYRYRVEYVKDFLYHDNLVREHDLITMAVLKGDADSAEKIMKEHIYNQEQIVIKNVTNAE